MIKLFLKTKFAKVALLIFAMSLIFLVLGVMEIIDDNTKPIDYSTMTESQLEEGAIIEGDLKFNLGRYEEIEHTRNGSVESVDYCYVIPVGQKGYAGILSNVSDVVSDLDKQTEETYKMLNGDSESTQTVVHFKGKVVEMKDEDYDYFCDYLKNIGFSDAEINELGCRYYIQIRKFNQGVTITIVGAVIFVIALVLILISIRDMKKLKNTNTVDPYAESNVSTNTESNVSANTENPAIPTPEDFNDRY